MTIHIDSKNRKIAVIGLGYVGLPVAYEFSKVLPVIGFDINLTRIAELKKGFDRTEEISTEDLKKSSIEFSTTATDLANCNFFIITVPTPVNDSKTPDLRALEGASKSVGSVLKKGDIVVYESTVYPGATEEVCLPILEEISGLKLGDFQIGYSPERINPGDKEHTISKIKKVVSASSASALDVVAELYGKIITAGIYRASSIMVAEAAKVIENTQRDLNISLMNELAIIFERLGIDTNEVIDAASTKWNFLPFRPGLVGGHCIGVDPYYLTHKAEKIGYHPQVILSGRKINDQMGKFISTILIREMIKNGIDVSKAKVCILGATFKENCPDIRNSKVFDIVNELGSYNIDIHLIDPLANKEEVAHEYNYQLTSLESAVKYDGIIFAVSHQCFLERGIEFIDSLGKSNSVLMDIKGKIPREHKFKNISKHWRL